MCVSVSACACVCVCVNKFINGEVLEKEDVDLQFEQIASVF